MAQESQDRLELARRWRARIAVAVEYMREYGNQGDRWVKNIKAMSGDFDSVSELGDEAIDVNMVYSNVRTSLPPLWLNLPQIIVKPTKERTADGADNIRRAEVTEIELNYWFRELSVREEIRRIALDGEATNHGYAYIGYIDEKLDVETADGERTEPDLTRQHRKPFVTRISPRRVLVPPGYERLEDCPWVDLVFLRPAKYVRERYQIPLDQSIDTIRMDVADEHQTGEMSQYLADEECGLTEVHNIWCKESGLVYVMARGPDDFLEEPREWPYDVEGFPLVEYRPVDVPDEYWGTPPISYYLPQQKELNATRTAMRKRRNRTKAVAIVPGDIAPELKEKYANAQDAEIIGIEVPSDEFSKGLINWEQFPPFDQGDLAYEAVIKNDILEISGESANRRGAGDPNVGSATASATIEKHAMIRQSDRADKMRSVYLAIARKLWMVLKQFPDEKRSVMIAGPIAGQMLRRDYSLEELRGEFEFDLDVGAMIVESPQTRVTQSVLNYNLLRADPLINPEMLLLDIFKAQNKPNPSSYLLFLREPEDELGMMMQGLPVEAHERDDHMAHLEKHDGQGAQIEQALRRTPASSTPGQRLRLALALLQAHIQHHVAIADRMSGASQRPAGSPVAENMLRNQIRAAGNETQAELAGQPLSEADVVQ